MAAKAERAEVDVQCSLYGAVVWVPVIMGKVDFLVVIFVLMFALFDAHMVDVIYCEIADVLISEALFLLTKEGGVVPSEGE